MAKELTNERIFEMLDYATDYGSISEDTPNTKLALFDDTNVMNDIRRSHIVALKELLHHRGVSAADIESRMQCSAA